MPICIVAIVGGKCATAAPNSLLNKTYDTTNKAQQWTIERADDDGSKFAFKCELDGKYMRAEQGKAYGLVTTGAKQWWIAERGAAPGCFWLKSTDFPDAYLTNANASMADGNKIYCWPKQQVWAHALQWYLLDAAEGSTIPGAHSAGYDAEQAAVAASQVAEREKALVEREAAIKRRDAELTKKEAEASRDASHLESQDTAATELRQRLADLENKLQEKEKAAKALQEELNDRDAARAQSGQQTVSNDSRGSQGAGSEQREQSQEIERLKKQLAEAKAAAMLKQRPLASPWVGIAVDRPARKLPPIVRPAQQLPRGFDSTLLKRATGPAHKAGQLNSSA